MKAFIVTYGGGHVNIIKHVAPELAKKMDVKILALTVAPQILDESRIEYNQLSDYTFLFKDRLEKIKKYGEFLATEEYNPDSGMSYSESLLYLGIGFSDLVEELKDESLALEIFKQSGRKAFCPKRTMQQILEYEKPDIVIGTSSVRYEKAAGIAANQLGISVVHIHDLVEMNPLPFNAEIFVMNNYAKEKAVVRGVAPSEKIHVTGQPCFEYDLKPDEIEEKKIRLQFNIKQYQKVIIYLEQPLNKDIEKIENFLKRKAENNQDYLYIIKLHPNQDFPRNYYRNKNFIKIRKCSLKALLRISDIAITCDSTSGLEAALMGIPLVVVGIENEIRMDFSKYGIAIKVNSIDALDTALHSIDNPEVRDKLKNSQLQFKNKENSVNNIIDKIIDIIHQNK